MTKDEREYIEFAIEYIFRQMIDFEEFGDTRVSYGLKALRHLLRALGIKIQGEDD